MAKQINAVQQEDMYEKIFSAIIKSCCKLVILPLCEDNISMLPQMVEEIKQKQTHISRGSDLTEKGVVLWLKKVANLHRRADQILSRQGNYSGRCSCCRILIDNYTAALLLQQWEELYENKLVSSTGQQPDDDASAFQLTRQSTAPIGAMGTELIQGDRTTRGASHAWVLDSLGFRAEDSRVTRELVSNLKAAVQDGGTVEAHSTQGIRIRRTHSVEEIHEKKSLIRVSGRLWRAGD